MAGIIEVKSGDTLSDIAKRNGMNVLDLIAQNPQFKDPNLIRPGDTVFVSGKESSPRQRDYAATKMVSHANVALPSDPNYVEKMNAAYKAGSAVNSPFPIVPEIQTDTDRITPEIESAFGDDIIEFHEWAKRQPQTAFTGPYDTYGTATRQAPGLAPEKLTASQRLGGEPAFAGIAPEKLTLKQRLARVQPPQRYQPPSREQVLQEVPLSYVTGSLSPQEIEQVQGEKTVNIFGQEVDPGNPIATWFRETFLEPDREDLAAGYNAFQIMAAAQSPSLYGAQNNPQLGNASALPTDRHAFAGLTPGQMYALAQSPALAGQGRILSASPEQIASRRQQARIEERELENRIVESLSQGIQAEAGPSLTATDFHEWAGSRVNRPPGEAGDGPRNAQEAREAMELTGLALTNGINRIDPWSLGLTGLYGAQTPVEAALPGVISGRAANGAIIQPRTQAMKDYFKATYGVEGFNSVAEFMDALGYVWNDNARDPNTGEFTGAYVKKGDTPKPLTAAGGGTNYVYGGPQRYPYTPTYSRSGYSFPSNSRAGGYGGPYMSVLWRISA